MKKSRKLALVALGVVVVGVVLGAFTLLVQLSNSYSPWQPRLYLNLEAPENEPRYGKVRHQRYPWLPGKDRQSSEVTKEEFTALVEASNK